MFDKPPPMDWSVGGEVNFKENFWLRLKDMSRSAQKNIFANPHLS